MRRGWRISPTTLTFLKVVSRHGRLDCLRAIARAARKQLNAARGLVERRTSPTDRRVPPVMELTFNPKQLR